MEEKKPSISKSLYSASAGVSEEVQKRKKRRFRGLCRLYGGIEEPTDPDLQGPARRFYSWEPSAAFWMGYLIGSQVERFADADTVELNAAHWRQGKPGRAPEGLRAALKYFHARHPNTKWEDFKRKLKAGPFYSTLTDRGWSPCDMDEHGVGFLQKRYAWSEIKRKYNQALADLEK